MLILDEFVLDCLDVCRVVSTMSGRLGCFPCFDLPRLSFLNERNKDFGRLATASVVRTFDCFSRDRVVGCDVSLGGGIIGSWNGAMSFGNRVGVGLCANLATEGGDHPRIVDGSAVVVLIPLSMMGSARSQ
jgi:hypothetical protein